MTKEAKHPMIRALRWTSIRQGLTRGAPVALVLLAGLLPTPARANYTLILDTVFNGSTPSSTPPWLTATFADTAANEVTLTLTVSLDVASEFIDDVVFNVNPSILPSSLTITQLSGTLNNGIANTTQNAQNLPGGGSLGQGFDIGISWPTSNAADRFDGTESAVFKITGTSLSTADFNFANASGLLIAAHVQGIPGGLSGAITVVPEPSSIAMSGIGLAMLAGLGILRRRNGRSATD